MSIPNTMLLSALLAAASASCVLAPEGLDHERGRLAEHGRPFVEPVEQRVLPELPPAPTWRDLLQRAFLTNGEIEAAWQQWRAAVARVDSESTWPDTNVEVGIEHMFSSENLKAWDRTTLTVGFDPMQTLSLPSKTAKKGEIALSEAVIEGERFRAAKFALQRRFLETWIMLGATARERALHEETVRLARLSASAAARGATSGGNERELLRARIEVARAADGLARLDARVLQLRAELVGILGDPPVALAAIDDVMPERSLALSDAQIFAAAAQNNPELKALAREVDGRDDALDLARAQWLPDVAPFAGFTGGMSQMLGAAVSLPTMVPAIRAGIESAKADLARSQALARQRHLDVRARLTAEIVALRDAERATRLFADEIVPLARRLASRARAAYSGAGIPQSEWLEALFTQVDAETALVAARAARESSLARIEEMVGVDFETFPTESEVNRG
jgi:outer membrane protein, heavy metal efflux system